MSKFARVFLCLVFFHTGALGAAEPNVERHTSETEIETWKAPNGDDRETWRLMIGKWYGSQPTKDGGFRQEIVERYSDGKMKIVFRSHGEDGSFQDETEIMFWGVSGPIYFTFVLGWMKNGQFSPANSANPYYQDAYRIIELTDERFEYEHVSTANRFALERVPDDFEFPGLPL